MDNSAHTLGRPLMQPTANSEQVFDNSPIATPLTLVNAQPLPPVVENNNENEGSKLYAMLIMIGFCGLIGAAVEWMNLDIAGVIICVSFAAVCTPCGICGMQAQARREREQGRNHGILIEAQHQLERAQVISPAAHIADIENQNVGIATQVQNPQNPDIQTSNIPTPIFNPLATINLIQHQPQNQLQGNRR